MTDLKETKGTGSTSATGVEASGDTDGVQSAESPADDSTEAGDVLDYFAPDVSEAVREFREAVRGRTSAGSSWADSDAAADTETVKAHELRTGSGTSDQIRELSKLLAERTENFRNNDRGIEWTDRSPEQWREEYNVNMYGNRELRDAMQTLVGGPDDSMSDAEIARAVDRHRQQLESEGAFEDWSEHDIQNWEKGVTEFLANRRAHSKLAGFEPGAVRNLPNAEIEDGEIQVDAPADRIDEKLDAWERQQLQELEAVETDLEGEPTPDQERRLREMREQIQEARTMYEELAVGEGRLPEVAPSDLGGIDREDDLEARGEGSDPGLDENLTPVREPYVEHLRDNPGDIVGAYEVVQERTEASRFIRAGKIAAPT